MDSHHGIDQQVVVESRGETTTESTTTTTTAKGNDIVSDIGASKSIEIDTKMNGGGNGQQLSELIQLLETCQLGGGAANSAAALQQNLISSLLNNENATKVAVSSSSSSNSVSPQQQQQQSSNTSPSGGVGSGGGDNNANLLALAQIMLQQKQQQKSSSNTSPPAAKSSALLNPASNTMQQALDSIYNMNGSSNGNSSSSSSSNAAALMAAAQLLKVNGRTNGSTSRNTDNNSSPPLSSSSQQPSETDGLSDQLLLDLIRQHPNQLEQLLKLNSLYKMSMTNSEVGAGADSPSNSSSNSSSSTNSTSNMSAPPAVSNNISSGTLTPTSGNSNGISLIEELQQHLDPVAAVAAATVPTTGVNNIAAGVSNGAPRNSPKPHYMNQMPPFQQQPPQQQNYNQLQQQLLNNLNLNALNHLVNRNDIYNNVYKQPQGQSPNLGHQGLLHQQQQQQQHHQHHNHHHHQQQHHHHHASGGQQQQQPQINAQLLAQYAQVSPQHHHLLQQLASGNVHAAAAAVHNLLGNGGGGHSMPPMMNNGPSTSSGLSNGPFGNVQLSSSGNGLPDLTQSGALVNPNGEEKFSRKVFVGGLPPDIDEDEIVTHFRRYGNLIVDWPHKAESKSYFPPKGYAFLIFQEERSVQELIETCVMEDGKLYLVVSSPSMKDKPVQIRPWCLADSDFVLDGSQPLDPRKTIFVGGVPRPLKALELAMIMNRFYGGVCYAGIDTDPELKYPKGAGRVAFSNQQSYIAAISARFVQLQHGDIDKRVEVKPYVLDDQMCDECQGARCGGKFAPFFCANVTCLQYYCEACWATIHTRPGREYHKPLVKEGADRPRSLPYK